MLSSKHAYYCELIMSDPPLVQFSCKQMIIFTVRLVTHKTQGSLQSLWVFSSSFRSETIAKDSVQQSWKMLHYRSGFSWRLNEVGSIF